MYLYNAKTNTFIRINWYITILEWNFNILLLVSDKADFKKLVNTGYLNSKITKFDSLGMQPCIHLLENKHSSQVPVGCLQKLVTEML